MGGDKAPTIGFAMGILTYIGCGRAPFKVERVPYRLMLGTIGYGIGVNLASKWYGDKNHNVYYTKKEQEILILHFGQSMVNRIRVIDEVEE